MAKNITMIIDGKLVVCQLSERQVSDTISEITIAPNKKAYPPRIYLKNIQSGELISIDKS